MSFVLGEFSSSIHTFLHTPTQYTNNHTDTQYVIKYINAHIQKKKRQTNMNTSHPQGDKHSHTLTHIYEAEKGIFINKIDSEFTAVCEKQSFSVGKWDCF